jgi:hypothetical protein
MDGPGIPGWFVGLFVLIVLIGVGGTVYRVSTARRIARGAGLNEDDAAATALLTDNGLDTTYLAASLRSGQPQTPVPAPSRTAEERLQELQRLKDQGLITGAEYDARRRAILDAL